MDSYFKKVTAFIKRERKAMAKRYECLSYAEASKELQSFNNRQNTAFGNARFIEDPEAKASLLDELEVLKHETIRALEEAKKWHSTKLHFQASDLATGMNADKRKQLRRALAEQGI